MASEHAPTAPEYIGHHLRHWQNHAEPQAIVDWSYINYDSVFWSFVMGALAVFLLWRASRKATSGVPGKFQGFVELLVEMVDTQAKSIIPNATSRKAVAPLALTVFVWIFFMNAMDLIPVDLLPRLWTEYYAATGHDPHHAYMRVVPTADLSITLGMSISVLLVCLYYNMKIKGVGGWIKELFTAPFHAHGAVGTILLIIPNFFLNMVEFGAKTISHGMRLWGNMYAGELVFMLIALLGAAGLAGVEARRNADFHAPRLAAAPAGALEVVGGGGQCIGNAADQIAAAIAITIHGDARIGAGHELRMPEGTGPGAGEPLGLQVAAVDQLEQHVVDQRRRLQGVVAAMATALWTAGLGGAAVVAAGAVGAEIRQILSHLGCIDSC